MASVAYLPPALAALLCAAACSQPSTPEAPATPEPPAPPEAFSFAPDREGLSFTYRAPDSGRYETAESVEAIPEAARDAVVVVDLELSPEARGSGRYVHVADLTRPDAEGRFTAAVASRHGFDTAPSTGSGEASSGSDHVVVYSASWCGVCKKAKRALDELGVHFEEKDIEASKKAAEELATKAAAAGFRPGGVPVIDVRGIMLQGFDRGRLEAALRQKKLL